MDEFIGSALRLALKKGLTSDIREAARATDRAPSAARAKAGTYRKGRFKLNGLTIVLETPRGAIRSGVSPRGEPWSVKMPAHYGYIARTVGADGDQVDIYVGPKPAKSGTVYVVDQINADTGGFDEHKCVIGCQTTSEAIRLYDAGFSDGKGPSRRGAITPMSWPEFKAWLRYHDTTAPVSTSALRLTKAERGALELAAQYQNRIANGLAGFFSWMLGEPAERMAQAAANSNTPTDPASVVSSSEIKERFDQATSGIQQAFIAGGRRAVNDNPVRSGDKVVAFSFDERDPRSQLAIDSLKGQLVVAIDDRQRQVIQETVSNAVAQGLPPATVARRVKEVVGLTATQAQHVVNYRAELENLDGNALGRQLRDKRYDGVVRRAIEAGSPLTEYQVDRMVAAYQRKYIARRAETIARTESIRAVNQGQFDAVRQAVQNGEYGDVDVEKIWIATKDSKTRDTHRALDGQVARGLNGMFISPSGAMLMHPHDPNAPAEEIINCRCTMAIRLVPRTSEIGDV